MDAFEFARRRGLGRGSPLCSGVQFTGLGWAIGGGRAIALKQMLDDGCRGRRHGMGLAVDDGSRAGDRLWALGPLTKGAYWEIVAVPDIRGQAAAVAASIATELGK